MRAANLKVHAAGINHLLDLTGELITLQSLLMKEADERLGSDDPIYRQIADVSKMTRSIHRISSSLRTNSLHEVFNRLKRVGYEAARELGKQVEILTGGDETEVDRELSDRLGEVLMHIVKNSVFHGIEEPQERADRGKIPGGRVRISALKRRDQVVIEVADDGRGLPLEKIYRKALEKGLITEDKKYGDKEIQELIFLPGFSTAHAVNSIAGRGVGLDAVKTEVERMGGKVEFESIVGQGSKFTVSVPVNLSVINGTVVNLHGGTYIIPTFHIKRVLVPSQNQRIRAGGKITLLSLQEKLIPVIPGQTIFGSQASSTGNAAVILEYKRQQRALLIDSVAERREIAVKSLENIALGRQFFLGAAIVGNGKIALIFDIDALFGMECDENWKSKEENT